MLRQVAALQGIADVSVVGLSPLPDKVHGINLVGERPLLHKGLLGVLLLFSDDDVAAGSGPYFPTRAEIKSSSCPAYFCITASIFAALSGAYF